MQSIFQYRHRVNESLLVCMIYTHFNLEPNDNDERYESSVKVIKLKWPKASHYDMNERTNMNLQNWMACFSRQMMMAIEQEHQQEGVEKSMIKYPRIHKMTATRLSPVSFAIFPQKISLVSLPQQTRIINREKIVKVYTLQLPISTTKGPKLKSVPVSHQSCVIWLEFF